MIWLETKIIWTCWILLEKIREINSGPIRWILVVLGLVQLVWSNIDCSCCMYVELRKKTLAAMQCSTKWEEFVAGWLFSTHGSLTHLLFEPSPNLFLADLSHSEPPCRAVQRGVKREREESARQSSSNRVSWSTAPQLIKAAHKSLVKARKVAERERSVCGK